MTLPCGERSVSKSPSLSSEGKLLTPIVLPKTANGVVLLFEHRIATLSGCKIKLAVMVAVVEASLNFHPFKLYGVDEIFLISMNSALGKLTGGVGSAITSVITISNRFATCAFTKKGRKAKMVSSVFENIELNVKIIFKDHNPFGWKNF